MSVHRLSDEEHREAPRSEHGREEVLWLVRQRLSQNARVVRLSGRTRSAVGVAGPLVVSETSPLGARSD